MCRKYFQKWYDALTKPKKTFRKERKNVSLKEAAKHIGLAGLIAGVIEAIIFIFLNFSSKGLVFSATVSISLIILLPILAIISLFIGSGIIYLFAKLFGGKGDYNTQTYFVSLYQAPLIPITGLITNIPVLGTIINFIIQIYILYLTTLALKETHNYSTGRAVATWLVPVIILMITVVLIGVFYISASSLLNS